MAHNLRRRQFSFCRRLSVIVILERVRFAHLVSHIEVIKVILPRQMPRLRPLSGGRVSEQNQIERFFWPGLLFHHYSMPRAWLILAVTASGAGAPSIVTN